MPPKLPTFVDASVLINAIVGLDAARKMRALAVLGDSTREFVATRFLQLEVIPIPLKFNKKKEVVFYERFFAGVVTWIDPASIIKPAYDLACQHGLGAIAPYTWQRPVPQELSSFLPRSLQSLFTQPTSAQFRFIKRIYHTPSAGDLASFAFAPDES